MTSTLYSPLSILPCFPSQFCFNCHIPCTTYLPLLFAHFVLFLFYFVRFIITCTTFLPFPCFIFIIPLFNAASLMSTLHCLYHFYLIPFDACLVLSSHQYSPSHASPSPFPLSFSFVLLFPSFASLSVHRPQPNENENGQDSKV